MGDGVGVRRERGGVLRWPIVALVFAGIWGCGSATSTPEAGAGSAKPSLDGDVAVRLFEFRVEPDQATAPTGHVTFAIRNDGDYSHEFKVARVDAGTSALPTGRDGSVKEDADGFEIIAEVPARRLGSGYSNTLTLDLDAGDYVLFCNIVIDAGGFGPTESHYKMGMHTTFVVT